MEIKYASDLKLGDKILDKKTGEVVIIDGFGPDRTDDRLEIFGYFETFDGGADWSRTLDADSQMKVV